MTLSILSERATRWHTGWHPIFEFEDLLVAEQGARLTSPTRRGIYRRPVRRLVSRLLGPYVPTHDFDDGPRDTLLCVALTPPAIDMIRAVPRWREFRHVVAYVIDSYYHDDYPPLTGQLDHVFVPIPADREPVHQRWKIPVSVLPLATDTQRARPDPDQPRPIDVLAYGRLRFDHLTALAAGALRDGRRFQDGIPHDPHASLAQARDLFWSSLQRAQVSLAYDTMIPGCRGRRFDVSIVTPRWFEALAAGCVLAGQGSEDTQALFDWEDAVIPVPDAPADAWACVQALLDDPERLAAIRARNLEQIAERHDWRQRIETLQAALTASPATSA